MTRISIKLSKRRARRPWGLVLAAIGVLLVIGIGALYFGATYRPRWYQPPAVDFERVRDDKAAVINLVDQIGAALNVGREIEIVLDQQQVNRWLAARREIWPDKHLSTGPLEQPMVRFTPDGVWLAATADVGQVRGVVMMKGNVEVSAERLRIRYEEPHVGALPVPRDWLSDVIANLAAADDNIQVDTVLGLVSLPNGWIWENGKRPFRIRAVTLGDGELRVSLAPIERG